VEPIESDSSGFHGHFLEADQFARRLVVQTGSMACYADCCRCGLKLLAALFHRASKHLVLELGLSMRISYATVCISLMALIACRGTPEREPSFVPARQLEDLRTALSASVPSMWTEVRLVAERRDILLIDLRLAPGLGEAEFEAACVAATRASSAMLSEAVQRQVRLIREWRVIHEC